MCSLTNATNLKILLFIYRVYKLFIKHFRWKTTNCGWDGVSSYWLYKRRHVIEKDLKPIIVKIGNENFNADGISKCHVYQLLNLVQSENEVLIVTNSLKYFAK